jgi:predicted dehydrogenase
MTQGKIRVGILGAGAMGTEHAAAYADMAEVEVVGVFSRDDERARSAAAVVGAQSFTDAMALIEQDGLDAIDVCLPSTIHARFVIAALNGGRHVFCETPLALELEEARQMRDAARRVDRLLQVGLLMRSVGPYQHVRAAVASGEHGRLVSLTTYRLGSYLRPGAADHKAHYGNPSTELMTFDFDVANWLIGRPSRLAAAGNMAEAPGEITATLVYDDGAFATITASGLMPSGCPFSVGFRALFDEAVFELSTVFGAGPPKSRFTVCDNTGGPRKTPTADRNPYEVELERFIACTKGLADPELLDVDRAIEALELSIATQRSIREQRWIPIGI